MPPPPRHSRANLVELRAQIADRIGLERSELYFHYVNSFLSLKLGKVEFEKLCAKVLGKENLRLHNQLVRAILRNACCGKEPPASPVPCGSKSLTNGDVLHLPSPRTSIGILRHPYGVVNISSDQMVGNYDGDRGIYGNGTVGVHKSMQHHQATEKGISQSSRSQNKLQSSGCGGYERSQIKAPLGVPLFPDCSSDRAWKTFLGGSYYQCTSSMGLLDSQTLRDRMQHYASAQGLEAVSIDCANLLNKGLDAYLRRLMNSCFEVMGARHRSGSMVDGTHSHFSNHQIQFQNNGSSHFHVTLTDFKVSMELNPQHLGVHWPLQLEKSCASSFDVQSN
ncbi:hypothetical protein MLD38_029373 [Melastoma candidum]|uniref:Uncharacterized protein n=1 Tax=Melastoma candidum TaxID=119954 RepID=A0ACB9N596_9MYRT|nr:hypothetical protein MLD38_029373 [Melastoma candidum]